MDDQTTQSTNLIKSRNKIFSNLHIYCDKLLGKGSFSKVFPGKYKGKLVAVKIISTKHLDSIIAQQLQRELDVIKILQDNPHPNIATYYKIIKDTDKMIIVMELCLGGELTKYIKNGLDLALIRKYYMQILDGYKHLLELNIIHRDIKSANILLSHDKQTIKFIDFGLSKIFTIDLNQTICGSPHYMAPELLDHQNYNSKSDIWSIGVLLYEMVYGYTPFHNCKIIKTLKQTVKCNEINYYDKMKNGSIVPDDLIEYLKNLLELNPSDRANWDDLKNSMWLKHEKINDNNISTDEYDQIFEIDIDKKPNNNTSNNNNNNKTYISTHETYGLQENDKNITRNSIKANHPFIRRTSPIPINNNRKYIKTALRQYDQFTYPSCKRDINERFPKQNVIGSVRGESFGTINNADIKTNNEILAEIDAMTDYFDKEYEKTVKHQKEKATESGLLDIRDINDDMLIQHVPEKTTAYEYISKGSCMIGNYIYSTSAPVASTIINKMGTIARKTKKKIKTII